MEISLPANTSPKYVVFNKADISRLLLGNKSQFRLPIDAGEQYKRGELNVGDNVAVLEEWGEDKDNYLYPSDFSKENLEKLKNLLIWIPANLIPDTAIRFTLEITEKRIQPLPYICNEELELEGFPVEPCSFCSGDGCCKCDNEGTVDNAYLDFMNYWEDKFQESFNGWGRTPLVEVYDFKLVKRSSY